MQAVRARFGALAWARKPKSREAAGGRARGLGLTARPFQLAWLKASLPEKANVTYFQEESYPKGGVESTESLSSQPRRPVKGARRPEADVAPHFTAHRGVPTFS